MFTFTIFIRPEDKVCQSVNNGRQLTSGVDMAADLVNAVFHFIRCPCCFVSYNCLTSINCSDYVWNISSYKELRICHLCNTTDRGDEFHYLLKFDYFNGKRKTCIDKKKYFKNGSILKFGTLMNLTKKIQNIKTIHFYKKY